MDSRMVERLVLGSPGAILRKKAIDELAGQAVDHHWRTRLYQHPGRLPAAVPPVRRSRVFSIRANPGLATDIRMGLRAPDVSPWPQRRLSRTLRWRLAPGPLALDAGLSARRPALLSSCPPPDSPGCTLRRTARQPR